MLIAVPCELNLHHRAFRLAMDYSADDIAHALSAFLVRLDVRMPTADEQRTLSVYKTALAYHMRGVDIVEA